MRHVEAAPEHAALNDKAPRACQRRATAAALAWRGLLLDDAPDAGARHVSDACHQSNQGVHVSSDADAEG